MNKGLYYYVTIGTDQDNYHFLHRKGCKRMPDKEEVIFIGTLYNLSQALSIARINFKKVKPCIKCCIRYSAPVIHESVQPVAFPAKDDLTLTGGKWFISRQLHWHALPLP